MEAATLADEVSLIPLLVAYNFFIHSMLLLLLTFTPCLELAASCCI